MPQTTSTFNVGFKLESEDINFPILTLPLRFEIGDIITFESYDFDKMDYVNKGKFRIIDIEYKLYGIGEMGDVNMIVYLERFSN